VISMLEYIIEKGLETDVLLFYSNITEDDIAFKQELKHWQSISKNIKIYFTVTACDPKDSSCLKGRIDKEMITDQIKDASRRMFFIFGPPKMVEAMTGVCEGMGCDKEDVRIENFIGY